MKEYHPISASAPRSFKNLIACVASALAAGQIAFAGEIAPRETSSGKNVMTFSEAVQLRPNTQSHVRIGYRAGFGASASFRDRSFSFRFSSIDSNLSVSHSKTDYSAYASGIYDDGFVSEDISGNAGDKTWNWAYSRDSQVQGDSLQLSRKVSQSRRTDHTSITRTVYDQTLSHRQTEVSQDHSNGAEVVYSRSLLDNRRFSFGIEAGVSFNRLSASSSGISVVPVSLRSNGNSRTKSVVSGFDTSAVDSYSLDGVIAPLAPYSGSFRGPSAVIGAAPSSSTTRDDQIAPGSSVSTNTDRFNSHTRAIVDGVHDFEADVFSFRIGPYIETKFTDRLAASLGAGIMLNLVDAEASYSESILVPASGGSLSRSGRNSDSELLFGAYVDARLALRITNRVSVYGSSQLQFSDDFTQRVGTKTVTADFGSALFLGAGLQFEF